MTDLEKQFREMKEGDKVWVDRCRNGWAIHNFKRVTKTMLVTTFGVKDMEYRFDIQTGRQKGTDRWTFVTATPFTEEPQKIVDRYKLNRRADSVLEALTKRSVKSVLTEEDIKLLEEMEKRYANQEK